MNERALANKLRISIIEHISAVDLPAFLFEQIDQWLLELNYFKLSNLHMNLDTYITYLEEIQAAYINFIKTHNPLQEQQLAKNRYEPFMTNSLYDVWYECNFSRRELIKIESLFSVNCILRMKEFVNRRILKKKAIQKELTK